jgi:hypothetical protein
MSYERLWERLLEFLNSWSSAAEVSPGRIEVTLEEPGGTARVVEIVMTPDEWDDMAAVARGDFDDAVQKVKTTVLGLRSHERFLVYEDYDLHVSAGPDLPVDPEIERLDELAARQHPEGVGRWVVTDRDGNVLDEFCPHRD